MAGDHPKLPIQNDPQLASYVSFVADGSSPLETGSEIGNSFTASSIGGYAAARVATVDRPTPESIRSSIDRYATTVTFSGVSLPKLSTIAFERDGFRENATRVASKGPQTVASLDLPPMQDRSASR